MQVEQMGEIAVALERIAIAHERVATALERIAQCSEVVTAERVLECRGRMIPHECGERIRARLVQWAIDFESRKGGR